MTSSAVRQPDALAEISTVGPITDASHRNVSTWRWEAATSSRQGARRQRNEDRTFTGDQLLAIADGMGGRSGGSVASAIAVEVVATLLSSATSTVTFEHLHHAVRSAHDAVKATARHRCQPGMGTTLTVAALDPVGQILHLAHVGDSAAYLVRDGQLIALTAQHTATFHDQNGVARRGLTRCVGGGGDTAKPDVVAVNLRPSDRLVLATDGAYQRLDVHDLARLSCGLDPANACAAIIDQAIRDGGSDDATVIVADIVS